MALATSNLPVSTILTLLGVSSARDIFYTSGVLKTKAQLEALVNKEGLNTAYCPGTTSDLRITNLLNDRSLKYFKGYVHLVPSIAVLPNTKAIANDAGIYSLTEINASHAWTMISKPSWVTVVDPSSGGAGFFSINITALKNTGNVRSGTIVFKLDAYSNEVLFSITQGIN